MEFDENSKNCHLSQGSEQEFVTILLPIGEEIRSNSDGPIPRCDAKTTVNLSKNFYLFISEQNSKGYFLKSQNT